MRRTSAPALLAAVLVGGPASLSACSSDGPADGEAGPAEPAGSAASPADGADGGRSGATGVPLTRLPRMTDVRGAVSSLDWDSATCVTDAGEQTVEAAVTNGSGRPRDYAVLISWVDEEGTVLGRGRDVVRRVPPDATAEVTVTAEVAPGAVACLPSVLRGRMVRGS